MAADSIRRVRSGGPRRTAARSLVALGLVVALWSCSDEGSSKSRDTSDAAACEGGECGTPTGCPEPFPDSCNGLCVNLRTSEGHCGACDHACPEGATCTDGRCECPASRPDECGGECVDERTDARHCGACDAACGGTCKSGTCNGVVELALGGQHTLARLADGTVAAWGYGGFGQLGTGDTEAHSTPVPLTSFTSVKDVAAGRSHSCVVDGTGTVSCFGDNAFGQLGAETALSSAAPVAIQGLGPAAQVFAGGRHCCALDAAGAVQCWGWNQQGQLGDGTTVVLGTTPVAPVGLPAVAELSLGSNHTCAREESGAVWCWGDNSSGQIGDGTRLLRSSPAATAVAGAKAVRAGGDRTCALLGDGTVTCWGGASPTDGGTAAATPSPVPGLAGVVSLTVGGSHACAVDSSGKVLCWGGAETADAGGTDPVPVDGLSDVREVVAGDAHTCALEKDGSAWCWGDDSQGQLGGGPARQGEAPGPVVW